jgi:DNA-directed RNA polymerase subunit K
MTDNKKVKKGDKMNKGGKVKLGKPASPFEHLPITKYEIARVLGQRAQQIADGAKPMVDTTGLIHAIDIAEREYSSGTIPLKIVREMPSGRRYVFVIKKKCKE